MQWGVCPALDNYLCSSAQSWRGSAATAPKPPRTCAPWHSRCVPLAVRLPARPSQARQSAPCVLFFDELDSIAVQRGNSGKGAALLLLLPPPWQASGTLSCWGSPLGGPWAADV